MATNVFRLCFTTVLIFTYMMPANTQPCKADAVHGDFESRFSGIPDLMQHFISTGEEIGASFTIDIAGDTVVDIWGGIKDQNASTAWERDTIVNVFSSTKTVTSLAALVLIDRGIIDPYEKVATYWPEFAQKGKEDIEIRHIISHTSGVPGWETNVTLTDIYDFEQAAAKLAEQASWWRPGTASGYHSLTHGFLIGEVIRRTTGLSLKQFVADELATPLGADFSIGVDPSNVHRVSNVILGFPDAAPTPSRDSISAKVTTNPAFSLNAANSAGWWDAELGAANGHGNARGLAKILSAITLGGVVDGKRILEQKTIELIFEEQVHGRDLVVDMNLRFGIGFGLTGGDAEPSWLPEGRICFWGGVGGSFVLMDLDRKMTIAYAMNHLQPVGLGSNSTRRYIEEAYRVVAESI
jgi:CubicO group peptidase (beta-lactamase class C family)